MSFSTARRDIENRLSDNWATTPIAWENVPFVPPNDEAWISLSIFEDDVRRITIGNPGTHRVMGIITISINIPESTGTKLARDHADSLAPIFRDKQFNGITCREAKLGNGGTKDGWYTMVLSVPFYWDGSYAS